MYKAHLITGRREQELGNRKYEALLKQIHMIMDERTKAVKGKVAMQKQRFRAVRSGVNLMLDFARKTFYNLQSNIEGNFRLFSQVSISWRLLNATWDYPPVTDSFRLELNLIQIRLGPVYYPTATQHPEVND